MLNIRFVLFCVFLVVITVCVWYRSSYHDAFKRDPSCIVLSTTHFPWNSYQFSLNFWSLPLLSKKRNWAYLAAKEDDSFEYE